MTRGGKVIDSGGFGCIFRPQLKCKKSINNRNKIYGTNNYDINGISKVMQKKYAIREYFSLNEFIKIIKTIPNYNYYFLITDFTLCRPQYFTPKDLIDFDKKKCSSLKKKNITTKNINSKLKEIYMINMPYGGIDIDHFLYKNINNIKLIYNFNLKMIDLLENAILPMNKRGLYHGDLKSNNMLVDVKNNNKMYIRIIDWGLSGIYLPNNNLNFEFKNDLIELNKIPEVFTERPFQFNVPFSSVLLSKNFIIEYNNYCLYSKDKYSLYEFIKRYINNYIFDRKPSHLKDFNSIFNNLNSSNYNSVLSSISYEYSNHNIISSITNINYIYTYLYEILQKYTKNNSFNVFEYFSNVYIKNLDIWGFILSYYPLVYFNNKIFSELIKKLLAIMLKYSNTPINVYELKEILNEFSNNIINLK
jgi:hypothetical protein